MAMTVAQLIVKLEQVPNHDALVTLDDTAGANLTTVDVSAATQATFGADSLASELPAPAPGTVDLVGGA